MASPGSVPAETIQIAEDSYRRCSREGFFQAFYQRLLASDESIRRKFATTDFGRQNKLLQHGLGLLFIYAKRANPAILDRIAVRHASGDLDIEPPLYVFFADTLVATVKEYDPQYTADVGDAWRRALAPGIAFMIARRAGPADAATPA